jgi:hypothetical protein
MVEKKGEETTGSSNYPKRYVITSAQASYNEIWNKKEQEYELSYNDTPAEMHENLLNGFENYCKIHNAELIILKMPGKNQGENIFDDSVKDRTELFFGNRSLNSNIKISDMVVPPQNVDPSTGRLRFAQRDTTLIYAHAKQRLRAVPASNSKLPRLLITTGAITTPNYNRANHKGDVAYRDHIYGGVIVEVIDNVCYNVRFLRGKKDGQFIDMGLKYNGKQKPAKAGIEALALGDIHAGEEDPLTMNANFEMIDFFKPKRLILHDLFDGHSVNPHEYNQVISRVREFEKGRLSLESELEHARDVLYDLSKAIGKNNKVYVVASNHSYFLNRYIQDGDFMKEPWNARIAIKLAEKMCDGLDPVEEGMKIMGGLPKNVTFLKLRDDLQVWGCQLASHGHRGNSGSRTSNAVSREIAHGKSITGHTHTPEVFRNTYIVGTSSRLDLNYTDGGANSWMAANAVLYDNGSVQLLPIIKGKWKPRG